MNRRRCSEISRPTFSWSPALGPLRDLSPWSNRGLTCASGFRSAIDHYGLFTGFSGPSRKLFQRSCPIRCDGHPGFALDRQTGRAVIEDEIHFDALVSSPEVSIVRKCSGRACLEKLQENPVFEKTAPGGVPEKLIGRGQPEQMAGDAGISKIQPWCLAQALPEVPVEWLNQQDLKTRAQNIQPGSHRGMSHVAGGDNRGSI